MKSTRQLILLGAFLLLLCAGSVIFGERAWTTKEIDSKWQAVEDLEKKQQYNEAAKIVEEILDFAKAQKDDKLLTRALIKRVILERALHGYETAARILLDTKWPEGRKEKALLHLFAGETLYFYYQDYGWEINEREKIAGSRGQDLKNWTADDIFYEINGHFFKAWNERRVLAGENINDYPEYITAGNYPGRIRKTMRDFLVYKWVGFLQNTAGWKPEHMQDVYKLSIQELLPMKESSVISSADLINPEAHPLQKMVFLLHEHYRWAAGNKDKESELEALLIWMECLIRHFTKDGEMNLIEKAFIKILKNYEGVEWWAHAQYKYARFIKDRGDYVRSRELARTGYEKYPNSVGGRECFCLMKEIEAPFFNVQMMSNDKAGERSIMITHANITGLYFRAYRLDLEKLLGSKDKNFRFFDNWNELHATVLGRKADFSWECRLQDPGDYRSHISYEKIRVDQDKEGLYAIAVSADKNFSRTGNQILVNTVSVSSLSLIINQRPREGSVEVFVTDGLTGEAVRGAEVRLYRQGYRRGPVPAGKFTTDQNGLAILPFRSSYINGEHFNFFLTAHKGRRLTIYRQPVYFNRYGGQEHSQGIFVYTDRSIYRPLQKVYYKVVAYKGNKQKQEYTTSPDKTLTIKLLDPNREVVGTRVVKTNNFGSASGEFTIPAGRLLGSYSISVDDRWQADFRVEEYKQPTFEVKILAPATPLRLNQKARIRGEARYYFGLPVTEGKVRYRVVRTPLYPWWYFWRYSGMASGKEREVAAGETVLNEDGTFEFGFLPEADEDIPQKESLSYNFSIIATVTDAGGESREARFACRIGFVSVETVLRADKNFYVEGDEPVIEAVLSDLSGTGRAGKGSFKLFLVKSPQKTLRTYEHPVDRGDAKKKIPGDTMQPRWAEPRDFFKTIFDWEDGKQVASGTVNHDKEGHGRINLKKLSPGIYRLRYETRDELGGVFKTWCEVVVTGKEMKIPASHYLIADKRQALAGDTLKVFMGTGFKNKPLVYEIWCGNQLAQREFKTLDAKGMLLLIPVTENMRGGFTIRMYFVEDFQLYRAEETIAVPFDQKELRISFASFRDLLRPGQKETWTVNIKGPQQEKVAAEVLAYMYDRSLDYFIPHSYPSPSSFYMQDGYPPYISSNSGKNWGSSILHENWFTLPEFPVLLESRFSFFNNYSTGGPGSRFKGGAMWNMDNVMFMAPQPAVRDEKSAMRTDITEENLMFESGGTPETQQQKEQELRLNFAETAFFQPHLLTDKEGNVKIEFTVPDSVTSWNIYTHALTKDLKFMTAKKEAQTRKELMVRPYLPRFFREGDSAWLKVVINNAGQEAMEGEAKIEILDPETGKDAAADFKLTPRAAVKKWKAGKSQSTTLAWKIEAPQGVRTYAFKVTAQAGDFSDGELRPVPVLPSRVHLVQSKFMTLKDNEVRSMTIEDMKKAGNDPSLKNESLVVTLDGQLIYTVLRSLPYLVNYPYECTEQTLNRFLSTSIVTSLYDQYPPLKKMARQFSERKTQYEPWQENDPNRKLALEETPWLRTARGGNQEEKDLINIFDARVAEATRRSALLKLKKAQLPNGGFPWFVGGPASEYMTLYILYGFAKVHEFKGEVPRDMVRRAWAYLKNQYESDYRKKTVYDDFGISFLSFLNYVLSSYPGDYYENTFTLQDRQIILDKCFAQWRKLSPYNKAFLSLTLNRFGRKDDAKLVLASIMDSAITKKDQGTFWAREDRSWLWYNDHIESHAFILRTLLEISPGDKRADGLVLWLLLNKKMNRWKSTRTTAEVLYSLTSYLKAQGALGVKEEAKVTVGRKDYTFIFNPDEYTGAQNQIVIEGEKVRPEEMAEVKVDKKGKGTMFASMTWHYNTEKLPEEEKGDVLFIRREYFIRRNVGKQYVLLPLKEGTAINIGDQVEVHLSITCKNPMEYVHLRDPRAGGLEPESPVSGHHRDMGIYWYEEVRDSGANFFFTWLPQGEYKFKYRLRANMAGNFRTGPAVIQSMYAPEFAAFSKGAVINIQE